MRHDDSREAPAAAPDVVLTQGATWQWRAVVEGSAREWKPSPEEALAGLAPRRRVLDWPTEWVAFDAGKWRRPWKPESDERSGPVPAADVLASVPTSLVLGGEPCDKAILHADARHMLDLVPAFGAPRNGRTAYLFAELPVPEAGEVTFHVGSDYWMQVWVDGRPGVDTLTTSNRVPTLGPAWTFRMNLDAGRHVIAVRAISGNGGWSFAGEASRRVGPPTEGERAFTVEARLPFDVPDPREFASLTFIGPEHGRPQLNHADIPQPLHDMRYRVVPGIPPALLRAGENELNLAWDEAASRTGAEVLDVRHFAGSGDRACLRALGELHGLTRAAATIRTGPLLHTFGERFFTLSCRTNMLVPVVLEVDGRSFRSEADLIHRFAVERLEPGAAYAYSVRPDGAVESAEQSGRIRTMPRDGEFTFAVMGDPATVPQAWARAAGRVREHEPLLTVLCGDMVGNGLEDAAWDDVLFGLGRELFACTPIYPAIGNHDKQGGLAERLFMTPGGGWNWSQRLGDVLLIGVDGSGDVDDAQEWAAWLDEKLADSDAKFVFLFNHYPAWSSAGHGRLGDDGEPVERNVRFARHVIVPALARHNATAMFNGHDHCFELSELPGGLTEVTTGGAGSYLYEKTDDPNQNPYSKVFASAYHYCLVRVTGDRCELAAIDLDGNVLCQHAWDARRT